MKALILIFMTLGFGLKSFSQSFETKTHLISITPNGNSFSANNKTFSTVEGLNELIKKEKDDQEKGGFSLKSMGILSGSLNIMSPVAGMTSTHKLQGQGIAIIYMVFEKQNAIPEDKLSALRSELIAKMDEKAKTMIEKSESDIRVEVLNFLRTIPEDVITKSFKDELTNRIVLEAEIKFKEIAEELKREVRGQN